jgi:predicted ATP-grasp superfamily ATP-dependent carboligase
MPTEPNLLIFGASARAAAFSVLRAGLRPWCADLFADADLHARCATVRVPGSVYPEGFLRLARGELPGAWMYAGGLENQRGLVEAMEKARPLWGNGAVALPLVRWPWFIDYLLARSGLPHPAVYPGCVKLDSAVRWLVKPVAGAGGTGIHFWGEQPIRRRQRPGGLYYQAYVEGTSCAAVYLGNDGGASLLGVTRQLVGEPWLHAAPFHYCGSVGPLVLEPGLRWILDRVGNVLADGCRLRGLFGVDFILRDGVPWPVEVNPRYTASVEVLEYAAEVPALALHRQVFDPHAPVLPTTLGRNTGTWLGKAILFARAPLTFPEDGPWQAVLREPPPLHEAPPFADIPRPGERIAAGRPVLTFFARGSSDEDCVQRLQQIAAALDRSLFA